MYIKQISNNNSVLYFNTRKFIWNIAFIVISAIIELATLYFVIITGLFSAVLQCVVPVVKLIFFKYLDS
jgi:hypothetical protein